MERMMAGQHQHTSADGSHTTTVGSADDRKGGASAFVSQQDDQGNKWTVVYDKDYNIVKEVTKSKK